jgi:hypothetical protein
MAFSIDLIARRVEKWRAGVDSRREGVSPYLQSVKKKPAVRRAKSLCSLLAVLERSYSLFDVLAVQHDVETFTLFFFGHTQADDHVDDLQQDEADDAAIDDRRQYTL